MIKKCSLPTFPPAFVAVYFLIDNHSGWAEMESLISFNLRNLLHLKTRSFFNIPFCVQLPSFIHLPRWFGQEDPVSGKWRPSSWAMLPSVPIDLWVPASFLSVTRGEIWALHPSRCSKFQLESFEEVLWIVTVLHRMRHPSSVSVSLAVTQHELVSCWVRWMPAISRFTSEDQLLFVLTLEAIAAKVVGLLPNAWFWF